MFLSERIVFVELHKTGCTHIGKLLSRLLDGRQEGKHNRPNQSLLRSGRYFIGSVRDPWDWYVSLWAYGCDHRGAVYEAVTKRTIKFRERGWREHPFGAGYSLLRDVLRNSKKWKEAYSRVDDPSKFRDWLQMMNDRRYWRDFGDGFASYKLSTFAGLMTYRYLKLFCRNDFSHLGSYAEMRSFEARDCYINYFIRNEHLEDDLVRALASCGVSISDEQKTYIRSLAKTNASSRREAALYYYDEESIDLVRRRERMIIEKFDYSPPNLSLCTAGVADGAEVRDHGLAVTND